MSCIGLLMHLRRTLIRPCVWRVLPHQQVLRKIKELRSDCFSGPENIPTNLLSDHLASRLTHIINTYISKLDFPTLWKTARISPIPKVGEPQANDNFRPVSNFTVLSKLYERLSLWQMVNFLSETAALQPNVSANRKGHSTTTTLLAIRDHILKAMNRGEVTIAI